MKTEQIMALAADLRSRINPAYAAQLGTESYERRLCAEAIESLVQERDDLSSKLQQWKDLYAELSASRDTYQVEADKLAAENKALRDALSDAATSLETISALAGRKTYGLTLIPSNMDTFEDVRGYATSRSGVARKALQGANHEPT